MKRNIRDAYYKAGRGLRNKSIKDLGYRGTEDQKIFIAESLTQKNKLLFNKCLDVKRDPNYKYLWTSSGKILIRRDASSPVIHLQSEMDIPKL